MSDDLVERLRAALDQAERLARAATPGPWHNDGPDTIAEWTVYDSQWSIASATAYDHDEPLSNKPGARGPGYIDPNANALHIAAWDPSRVLKLIKRDRALLAELARVEKLRYADERATRSWAAHLQGLRDEVKRAAEFWLDDSAKPAALPDAALDLGDPR